MFFGFDRETNTDDELFVNYILFVLLWILQLNFEFAYFNVSLENYPENLFETVRKCDLRN